MLLHQLMMFLRRHVTHLVLKFLNTKPLAADGTDASCVRPCTQYKGG